MVMPRVLVRDLLLLLLTLISIALIAPWKQLLGDSSPSGQDLAARGPALIIAIDNGGAVYVDSLHVGMASSWERPLIVPLQADAGDLLVAVEAINAGGPGGLLGMRVNGPLPAQRVAADWRCTAHRRPGWTLRTHDDDDWQAPLSVGEYGTPPWGRLPGLELAGAEWFWDEPDVPVQEPAEQTIFCRWLSPGPHSSREQVAAARGSAREETARDAAEAGQPGMSTAESRNRFDAILAADNEGDIYLDGKMAATVQDWSVPRLIPLSGESERVLIAVEATNAGGEGGLLGVLRRQTEDGHRELLPATWHCSSQSVEGWNQPWFAAEGWQEASIVAPYGAPPWKTLAGFDPGAGFWVWTRTPVPASETIYCRWWASTPARSQQE
jgi:hypothetical protein